MGRAFRSFNKPAERRERQNHTDLTPEHEPETTTRKTDPTDLNIYSHHIPARERETRRGASLT